MTIQEKSVPIDSALGRRLVFVAMNWPRSLWEHRLVKVSDVKNSRGTSGRQNWLGCVLAMILLISGVVIWALNTSSPLTGTITGELQISPPLRMNYPTSGTVFATSADGHDYSVSVGANGIFALHLIPGTYSIVGNSPMDGNSTNTCGGGEPIRLSVGSTHHVQVTCMEK